MKCISNGLIHNPQDKCAHFLCLCLVFSNMFDDSYTAVAKVVSST